MKIFGDVGGQMVTLWMNYSIVESCKSRIDLSNGLECPNKRSYAKVMTPGSRLFNLSPRGCKLYKGSSSRVMFWTFGVLALILIINMPHWPHFVFILAWMRIETTSLLMDSYHYSSCCIYSLVYFHHFNRICVYCISVIFAKCMCLWWDLCYFISFRHKIG